MTISLCNCKHARDLPWLKLETAGLEGESHIKTIKTKTMIAPVFTYRVLWVCAMLAGCLSEIRPGSVDCERADPLLRENDRWRAADAKSSGLLSWDRLSTPVDMRAMIQL